MKLNSIHLILFLILILGLFLYFHIFHFPTKIKENFSMNSNCPNILIKKNGKFILKNTRKAEVPGVNPIVFNNLEEYVEFIQWSRSQKINCPILYLQESYDPQGNTNFQFRPNPFNPEGGLPSYIVDDPQSSQGNVIPYQQPPENLLLDANRNDPPYNKNSYPGFDAWNQYIGETVPIDKMFHEEEKLPVSDMPTDDNWGGPGYSKKVVKSGYYSPNYVYDENNE